jgi:hypothetical protein
MGEEAVRFLPRFQLETESIEAGQTDAAVGDFPVQWHCALGTCSRSAPSTILTECAYSYSRDYFSYSSRQFNRNVS